MKLDLSILVVTYNCETFIEEFHHELTSSLEGHDDWELLYQDNSSREETWLKLQEIAQRDSILLRDSDNPGFATAVNTLIRNSNRKWLLLLNPDVSGFTSRFWTELSRHAVADAALFIRLLNPDGTPQDCVGRFPSLGRAFSPRRNYGSITKPTLVDMGIMAFMLVQKEILERVGPLDERFFMYGEDADWCYRADKLNVQRIYDPQLTLVHHGGASASSQHSKHEQYLQKLNSERQYIYKHHAGIYRITMLSLNSIKVLVEKLTGLFGILSKPHFQHHKH